MEKQASTKQLQQLSPQEWEALIEDLQSGSLTRRARWLSLPLFDLALAALHRRDFPAALKPQLLLLLEESHSLLLSLPHLHLPLLVDSLRSLLLLPPDPSSSPLKDQALLSSTAILISVADSPLDQSMSPHVESLVEILLSVINRPNHGPDRGARAAACECLRELERAFPCLLSGAAGHVWALAQAERTHAAQSYVLLLASIIRNIVKFNLLSPSTSMLSTSTPLIPFDVPRCVFFARGEVEGETTREPSEVNLREVRRVVGFLLDRPQALTPGATMELVAALVDIAEELEARVPAALLKVQFSSLIHSYDPVLCHTVLMLYSRFSDAFASDDEHCIARRLTQIAKEAHQPLVFRMLALHWMLGLPKLAHGQGSLAPLANCFYPMVFDPLALKAKKLDVLACIAACLDRDGEKGEEEGLGERVVKLFEDGLVCVSAFKWLPPWSTETAAAFRTLHKFLIGVTPHHSVASREQGPGALMKSTIFRTLQVPIRCQSDIYHVGFMLCVGL